MKQRKGKSLSVVLRRSVPKLFLILTASIPAVVIPSLVVGKSKNQALRQVTGECVSSKVQEPLSKSGRYAVGQIEDYNHFIHLIGENVPPKKKTPPPPPPPVPVTVDLEELTPVYEVPVNEQNLPLPEEKTFEQVYEEQKAWEPEATLPTDFEHPTRLNDIPPVPDVPPTMEESRREEYFKELFEEEGFEGRCEPVAAPPPPPPPEISRETYFDTLFEDPKVLDDAQPQTIPFTDAVVEEPPAVEEEPKISKQEVRDAYFQNLFPDLEIAHEVTEQEVTEQEVTEQEVTEEEPTICLEPSLEIAEVPAVAPPAPPQEEAAQPTPAPAAAPSIEPKSILKLFPLHPENFGKTEAKSLENSPAAQPPEPEPVPEAQPTPAPPTPEPAPAPEPVPVPVPEEKPKPVPAAPVPTPTPPPPPPAPTEATHAIQAVKAAAPQEIEIPTEALPTNAIVTPSPTQAGYLTNYTNLNIKEFIRFISRITNKNFIYNEDDLNFNISMISEKRSTAEELLAALMQQLRIHGLAVIQEGDSFIIHTNPEVNSPGTVLPRSPGEVVPDNVQLITQVFRLNVIQPSQAMNIIKPLLSAQAVIEPLDDSGILTLTDLKVNIARVKDLLIQLDQPSSGLDVSHFKSDYINSDTLVALGERILTPLAQGAEIRLIPLKNSNMIFIISTPIMVKRAIDFYTALDKEIKYNAVSPEAFGGTGLGGVQSPEDRQKLIESFQGPLNDLQQTLSTAAPAATSSANTEFAVYKLEYRKGDEIQQALSQIATSLLGTSQQQQQGAEVPTNDLYEAINTVQWIEASNTLVFTGTARANAKIKDLIAELDTPNQQVLIEMLLLDTSIDQSYHFGVDWGTRFGGQNAAGGQAFLSSESPLSASINQVALAEVLNPTLLNTATGFSLGVIGRAISCDGMTFSTIGALVTAIDRLDIGKVILNPKIVVEENNTAEIFVGLNIPFKTQSIANDFGTILTNNFEYRDVGARMTVTPIINKNGIITLEIEQELSTLVSSTTSVITNSFFELSSAAQGAGPTTRKSNSKTTVFVPNNHFVILSGMIQDESERIRTQIPCLGGIPVLGGVFSQKDNRDQNRNLVIFIRPSLINTEDEMTYYTKREQDIYDQKERTKDLWKYEIQEALDFLNINQDRCAR